MVKKRDSGLEMLRIIAMIQIIILHAYNFGGITDFSHEVRGSFLEISDLIWAFCRTPVNVFLLITGYFSVKSEFNIRKKWHQIGRVYLIMSFYSVSLSLAFWVLKPWLLQKDSKTEFIAEILKAFTPFLSRTWYYLTLFIIVSMLVPFINMVLQNLNKKQYLLLLSIVFFVTSIWPVLAELRYTGSFISVKNILNVAEGKSLYSFIFVYMLGGYIRQFVPKRGRVSLLYLLGFAFLCLSDYFMRYTNIGYNKVFGWYSNPFVIFEAVCLLLFFREFKIQNSFINTVAKATLGVYMIHEFRYVRKYLWKIFDFSKYSVENIAVYFLRVVCVALIVFTVCTVIELIREWLFDLIARIYKRVRKNAIE